MTRPKLLKGDVREVLKGLDPERCKVDSESLLKYV